MVLLGGNSKIEMLILDELTNGLSLVSDFKGIFFAELNQATKNYNYDTQFLSRYWNFQVLLNDGKIEKFYDQDLNIDKILVDLFKEHKTDQVYPYLYKNKGLLLSPFALESNPETAQKIFYGKLYQNTELYKYLDCSTDIIDK
jgi:hypothetical protein